MIEPLIVMAFGLLLAWRIVTLLRRAQRRWTLRRAQRQTPYLRAIATRTSARSSRSRFPWRSYR